MSQIKTMQRRRRALGQSNRYRFFILTGGLLFFFLMALSTVVFSLVLAPQESFFFSLAAALITTWVFILTLYYVWAIWFYNIPVRPPNERLPAASNSEDTLGLPPGTVRGTLALSVLIAGLAMMIASLALPLSAKQGDVMVDHFEFLKTGFIMVIAFYFGTKSLEILRNQKTSSTNDTTDLEKRVPAKSSKHEVSFQPEDNLKGTMP